MGAFPIRLRPGPRRPRPRRKRRGRKLRPAARFVSVSSGRNTHAKRGGELSHFGALCVGRVRKNASRSIGPGRQGLCAFHPPLPVSGAGTELPRGTPTRTRNKHMTQQRRDLHRIKKARAHLAGCPVDSPVIISLVHQPSLVLNVDICTLVQKAAIALCSGTAAGAWARECRGVDSSHVATLRALGKAWLGKIRLCIHRQPERHDAHRWHITLDLALAPRQDLRPLAEPELEDAITDQNDFIVAEGDLRASPLHQGGERAADGCLPLPGILCGAGGVAGGWARPETRGNAKSKEHGWGRAECWC